MLFNSYKLSSILINPLKRLANLKAKLSRTSKLNLPNLNRALLIGLGTTLSLGYLYAIEDDAIRNIRSLMNK